MTTTMQTWQLQNLERNTMYNLVVTSKAYQDIDEALNYITNILNNKKAATELVGEIIECQRILKENPFAYSKCIDKNLEERGYRRAVVKNYILLFKIEEQKRVAILRFFHGTRNYQRML